MIHYISPFDVNRNFGTSINNAIEQLNADENDWICLRDLDVAFLTPDSGRLIHEAVEKYGNEYDLIGCYTNRLGGKNQTIPSRDDLFFSNMNLTDHYAKSVEMNRSWASEVVNYNEDLAGMFLLFSVKIWRKIGGFKNTIVFDREFTKGVRMNGGKVGIMPGLYVLHCYRLWAPTREEARKSVDHLIK